MTIQEKYQPLDDRILILPDKQDEKRDGFYVADENKAKKLTGTVVAVGTGVPLMNVKFELNGVLDLNSAKIYWDLIEAIKKGRPMKVQVGDRVVYGQFAGTKVPLENEEYLMLRESDVFMIEKS
jgi:chaperonin GroES